MLEIRSGRPLTSLTQTLYMCILTPATAVVTKKKKKKDKNDISLCNFFLEEEVDWVVNDWVFSSSTFIDQERDCRCGI